VAQSNFGGIRGTVTDPTGAIVPGVRVEIVDQGTNAKYVVTSAEDGTFSAPALRPVLYTVSVEAKGFQKAVVRDVKVDTAKLQSLDITLRPGEVTTTVDVSAEAPLLQTYTGAVTNTMDSRTIVEAPLNGRNTIELALLLPGAAGNAGTEISETFTNDPTPGRELSINGGRAGSAQFLADGANVTSLALSRMSISFTPDTIQEFSVQQANYSAQYAQAGAIIQQTTKSGTNELRGSAYWFHRQKAFTANPFNTARQAALNFDARPPLRRQQVGFTAGGPVVLPKIYDGRNKTFFFVSYEPTRQLSSLPTASSLRIPSELEMSGDFSRSLVYFRNAQGVITTQPTALLYRQFNRAADGTLSLLANPNFNPGLPIGVNNARYLYGGSRGPAFELFNPNDPDPARRGRVLVDATGRSYVNPVAARLLKELYPAPNISNSDEIANLLGANYIYFRRTEYNDDRYSIKLDHRINDHHLVSGRYTWQPQFGNRFERDIIQHGLISDANTSRQVLATWTWTPNPTKGLASQVNEFRANYVFGNFARNFPEPLLNKDYTNEYLNIGGAGQGVVNLLGYGMPRFYDGGALKAATGATSGASIASVGFNSPQDVGFNREHSYSITDDYSWVRGKWTIKAGFSAAHLQLNQANLGVGSLAGGRFSWDGNYTAERNCSSNPVGGTLPDCSGTILGGDKFASFLLGVPSWVQVQTENLSIPYYYRWKNIGSYIQNDVKVTQNLTLNLGLRYQYQSPRWEKFNRQGQVNLDRLELNPFVYLPGTSTPAGYSAPVFEYAGFNGRSRYLTPPQKDVFEPRFGFAWTPGFDWNSARKFVLRGGYGITHGTLMGNDREPMPNIGSQTFTGYRSMSYILGSNDYQPPSNTAFCGLARCGESAVPMQLGFNNPVLASDPLMFNIPSSGEIRPGDAAQPSASRPPGQLRQDVRYQSVGIVGNGSFRMPTIQNYSLLAQYEVMRSTVLTMGYQGSRGTHLFGAPLNLNRVDPFTGQIPLPGFSGRNSNAIYLVDPTNSSSTYHALVTEVERRFAQGLQFRVNYTWSRNIDDNSGGVKFPIPNNSFANPSFSIPLTRAQNPYDSRSERAPAATDTPHILNMIGFWELPVGKGKRFLNGGGWQAHILGDWQLSGIGRIRSGYPITAVLGQANALDTGLPGGSIRPDILPGVPLVNPDWTPENAQFTPYVNPRAFAWPEPGRYGNAARNYNIRLPNVQTFDLSVFKRIRPWAESRRYFEIRAEFFNVLNHRVFESNINNTNLFSAGSQNPLLTGTIPFQTPVAGVENRNRNLTAPGVWDAIIAKSRGTPVDTAIANLPGSGPNGLGCPSNSSELSQTVRALSPACVARTVSLNGNFYVLNQNTVASRIVQFALKFYF
jgi:hypothetical protein